MINAKDTQGCGHLQVDITQREYRWWLYGDVDGISNGDTRLLSISSGPGKSQTMSVFLTKQLERHTSGKDDAELAFFCSAEQKRRNTAVAVLRD